jgi:hypothetical protein
MAWLTVEGISKDGKVELSKRPEHIEPIARLLVTFLPAEDIPSTAEVSATIERESLGQRAFARMREGIPLGGSPYPKREELYDRFC